MVTLDDGSFSKKAIKKIDKEPLHYATKVEWTGYADKYFLSAVLSEGGSIASVLVKPATGSYLDTTVTSPSFDLQPGQSHQVEYRLFFGPKGLDILKAQGQGLEKALALGWFTPIAKPLLYVLKYFYKYTHNYGIAIIIITLIIKILFFPLTHKSYKSMKDMQKLQPKMAELKEKYKDDRDALNRSIMELYRTHKVNPLGGCLPMVVQIPVFFALYRGVDVFHRTSPCSFHALDYRSVGQRSLLYNSGHYGCYDVYPAEDDADEHGSDAGEDDARLAGCFYLHVPEFPFRSGYLLVGE